jgi:hypothetical protein
MLDSNGLRACLQRLLLICAGFALFATEAIAADYGMHGLGAHGDTRDFVADEPSATAPDEPSTTAPNESGATASDEPTAAAPPGFSRLPGHVLPLLQRATPIAAAAHAPRHLSVTLVLKRDDQAGFDAFLREVSDPASKNYKHFLTQAALTRRFGPSRATYEAVWDYLRQRHLTLVQGSKNRLSLTVRGTREQIEQAFAVDIQDYRLGDSEFYANREDPALPNLLATRVLSVSGLANLAHPESVTSKQKVAILKGCGFLGKPIAVLGAAFLGLSGPVGIFLFIPAFYCALAMDTWAEASPPSPVKLRLAQLHRALKTATPSASGVQPTRIGGAYTSISATVDGTGQTIGLLEFDTFVQSDVANFLAFVGAPASEIGNLSTVPVNGGATPGADQSEVLLDIDTVMTIAPGAKVVVYDAPFSGNATSYSALFNAMINGGVTVISNSWASCENQMSLADAQGIDTVLQAAAASGISVFNGTGDSGSTCLDGSANTVSVPADSPNATAVGGTSLTLGNGFTYGSETWWNGSASASPTGQGGYGVSAFFARPSYQSALNPGTQRSVPDVAVNADPNSGFAICQDSDGGCPSGYLYGGTSMAAPQWAAFAALLNERLGTKLGLLNPAIYPFAGSNAFHSAASMGSDFAHVGLGSPNVDALGLALKGGVVGAVDAGTSFLTYPTTLVAGEQTYYAPVPADGNSAGVIVVTLADSNGDLVAGKTVSLAASSGSSVITPATAVTTTSGVAVFTVTDLTAEAPTYTATDVTDGITITQTQVLKFGVPPAASGGITANPSTETADGQSAATVTVTLKDALNRPTPGKLVTLADGGAHAVMTGPSPGITDSNGQIQFSVTDQVNETVTFSAIDVTDGSLPIPGTAAVTYSNSTSTACGVGVVPVASSGYAITPFVSGLPAAPTVFYGNANIGCPGANGPAFTSAGTVLLSDFLTGGIYQLGQAGGTVSSTNLLNTLTPALGGLVYGKDGSVYATLGNEGAEIVQIDPSTGALLRVVASGLTCPAGLSVDPLSGDLFFDDQCTGGGTDNASIFRVIDPAGTDASNPTSVVVYATLPTTPNGGMAFAPNGTLYAVSGYYNNTTAPVEQISGTNAASVTVTATGVTSDYAVSIGVTNPDGSAQSLIAEPSGNLSLVPLATPNAAVVLATGSPGVGVTGPDGCLYSAHYDTIYRLTSSSGTCGFNPTSPAPSINLTPATVSPNPAQGTSQTFTATLHNVASPAGIPVYFTVTGANGQFGSAPANASGIAVFSYTAQQAGADTVVAATSAATTTLTSNQVQVTWTAGKHSTFLSLNTSAKAGTVNQPVTVSATLADVSANPEVGLQGQSVTLTLGTATCTATTNASGTASCPLTPTQAGTSTLQASFAGSSQYVAASDSAAFNVSAGAAAAPTVTLTLSPTNVAAGAPATLTWASTNATACTASGAWSGSEATSGTETVTPSATGSYSYVLTCSGPGGTATATAVLSATLATVTVTAHSGGGAMSGILLALLGVLVLLRVRAARQAIGGTLLCIALGLGVLSGSGVVRADPTAAADVNSVLDHVYVGVRAGTMPINLSDAHLDAGLAAAGYGEVSASTHDSAFGGTLYVGYELVPHADLEFDYTHRDSRVATLSGTVASSASFAPLVQDTAGLIRGYGNIFAVTFRGRLEVAPRVLIDPRIGAFYWNTKVTAAAPGAIFDTNHSGGGLTLGIGAAYRVWRGLEIGAGVDYFDGSPNNSAVLYAGTLEWRFGKH